MPNKLTTLVKQAESLRLKNKLTEALPIYKKICELDKKNPNTWMIYGSIAGNIGKLDIAEIAFTNACKLERGFGKSDELLIQILEMQGKFDDALDILLKISSTDYAPNDIAVRIGVIYGKTKDYKSSIKWLVQSLNTDNNNAFTHHCLASAYESLDNLDAAEKHFKIALSFNDNTHVILNNYAGLLQKIGQIDAAIETYKKSIKSNNQYPISQYNLADLLLTRNQDEAALELFTKAVKLKPDYIEAVIGQGRCYQTRGANIYALKMYDKALSIDASVIKTYIHMSQAHSALGDFDSALQSLQSARIIDPDDIETQCSIAELYERRGSYNDAEAILKPLLKLYPDNINVVMAYASLCKKLNECDAAMILIDNVIADQSQSATSKIPLHFKAGKILNGIEQYDDAFRHYSIANEYQDFNYDVEVFDRSYANITTLFSKNNIKSLPRSTADNDSVIFIVGMPRSGTTLVEQILSSLPDVYGAGELPYLTVLSRHVADDFLSGNESITTFKNLDPQFLNSLTQQYSQSALKNAGNEHFFTDKMPHNFTMIGLINILFPNSKIVHCRRNPIDNCLSIFFSEFNSRHPYASNLKNLADYYTGYYEKLMLHWKDVNQVPLYTISYEDIVNDQEKTSRNLIDFCGFDWDDSCLNFHQSKRDVATISYDQVRQPIYNRSVERWRNYEKYIGPLLNHFKEYT